MLILYAVVEYPCEAKHFDLTPNRKKIISYTKKHYRPAAKRITTSNDISEHADITLITQQMHKEMSKLCSIEHHSILQDTHEGIKRFRWQTIWLEYQSKVPTLFAFYLAYFLKMIKVGSFTNSLLLKNAVNTSPVQCVISVLLYGNGAKK